MFRIGFDDAAGGRHLIGETLRGCLHGSGSSLVAARLLLVIDGRHCPHDVLVEAHGRGDARVGAINRKQGEEERGSRDSKYDENTRKAQRKLA